MNPPNVANEVINECRPSVAAEPPSRRASNAFNQVRVAAMHYTASRGETVTEEELGEQVGFQVATALALNPNIPIAGDVPPPWFTTAITPLIDEVRALSTQINRIDIRQRIQEAMLFNALAEYENDTLRPNAEGNTPPAIFPATRGDIRTLNINNLNELLNFYGEYPRRGSIAIKRRRLYKLIGVRRNYVIDV